MSPTTRWCFAIIALFAVLSTISSSDVHFEKQNEDWLMAPFIKEDAVNPILGPINTTTFFCPVRNATVKWESKDIFNPTALIKDGKVHLLYRAEDVEGEFMGTSRIGLATSEDGLNFIREPTPIFYPDNDAFLSYEWEGGCEDPRIVETVGGTYVMTYTAYNGSLALLMVATTKDLRTWTKYGPVFRNTEFSELWSKSGSIVTALWEGKFIATIIKGYYWMYWGDTNIYLAKSTDLVDWTPLTDESGQLVPVFEPRTGYFDSDLVEPGPQAIARDDGILMIYNGRNRLVWGDITLPEGTYSAGQIILDPQDPSRVISRSQNYFMKPDKDYELTGQINNVVFLEGLVCYKGKWFLYYGTADSKIAAATREDRYCS